MSIAASGTWICSGTVEAVPFFMKYIEAALTPALGASEVDGRGFYLPANRPKLHNGLLSQFWVCVTFKSIRTRSSFHIEPV